PLERLVVSFVFAEQPLGERGHHRLTSLIQIGAREMSGEPAQVFAAVALHPRRDVLEANRLEKTTEDSNANHRPPLAVEQCDAASYHHVRRIDRSSASNYLYILGIPQPARAVWPGHSDHHQFRHLARIERTDLLQHLLPGIQVAATGGAKRTAGEVKGERG